MRNQPIVEFLAANFRWIAGGFLLTFFSSFGQTFFIAASVSEWRAAFDLSHGEFGRLYMGATIASALCLPYLGRMVDLLPEARTIVLVMPVLAAATLLAAYAPTVAALAVALFLLRLFGQGMMTQIALTATGRWFSARRGRAVSLVVLGHQGGEAVLPLMFALLTVAAGHRAGWVGASLVLLLIGLPLALWAYAVPRTPTDAEQAREIAETPQRQWTRREVLRDPLFYVLLLGTLAPPFIGTTIFYHQDYLGAQRDWPPQFFAASLTLMALTTVTTALINGGLIDRYSARGILPYFLYPLALACLTLAIEGPDALLLLAMFLLGVSYGISSTLFGALWPESYGTLHLGAIRSTIVAAMVLATAAGPGLTGTLIDAGISLGEQFLSLAAYCIVAALAMIPAARRLQLRSTSG